MTYLSSRIFDLEERTLRFAEAVRDFLHIIRSTSANNVYREQLLRSSSSIGANYIEANDSLGKGDFLMKMKTSRREAKESAYWLRLIEISTENEENERRRLLDEALQFVRIFSKIVMDMKSRNTK